MFFNCHSYYSLRYGTMPVRKLIQEALSVNAEAIALTDINNTTAMPEFVRECRKAGIRPAAGIEFRNREGLMYITLARNNDGFRELNEFLSEHNISGTPLPFPAPRFRQCYVIYSLALYPKRNLFDNERIGIRTNEAGRLFSLQKMLQSGSLVILHPVTLSATGRDGVVHRCLRAVDNNTLLSRLPASQLCAGNEHISPEKLVAAHFNAYSRIVPDTYSMLADCSVDFDFEKPKNKQTYSASKADDRLLLEKLARDGMVYRYGRNNSEAADRIRHELDIIDKLGFSSYFLITWDIIRYSMSRGFYHVGRGSGANSIVAYCLRITNVDPIDLNLYFERFINPARSSPPDFDIDFSWKERDEIIDYIFRRYGMKHTALLGTISTFRGRSIVRELGKIHGLPAEEIDNLAGNPSSPVNRGEIPSMIFRTGSDIADFPNMRSIHAGGVLISEEPISCYTAVDFPPKGFPVTQWDMHTAEELYFEKIDILSQRGIGHIGDAVSIISRNRGESIDVHAIQEFRSDPLVKELLGKGETKGCFYIESPAMRGLLNKLKCTDYATLVAASSIIRPGVARSGMMREYINRFHNPSGFSYLHPVMKEQLSETFGVMVYQEDVLKICHHFAGLNLSDADLLRRAMSGKVRPGREMQKIMGRFFSNCRERGYPEEIISEVWRQIESFAGYSFSKAHSASYAIESLQSLYLKAHYPLEFMVAVINNFGGFYRTWVYVHEATRWGGKIHLPCVNNSYYNTTLYNSDIYLGFCHINNLEDKTASSVEKARGAGGPFTGLSDFIRRTGIGKEQLTVLIRCGALRFTGRSKAALLWESHLLAGGSRAGGHPALFPVHDRNFSLPVMVSRSIEDACDEIELLGFPVSMNWFDMLETSFRGDIRAADMHVHRGKKVRMLGHLVTVKYIKTRKNEWMNFGCFIDPEGNYFDSVHFPQSLKEYPFTGSGTYLMSGKISEEFGYSSIEVDRLARLPVRADPRY